MSSARSIPKKLRNYVASSASPQISIWISAGFAKHAGPTQRIESVPRAVASAAPSETTLATARGTDDKEATAMMRLSCKIRKVFVFVMMVAFLLAPAITISAKGKGFKDVVKHIETH